MTTPSTSSQSPSAHLVPELTPAQHALFVSAPDAPRRAVDAIAAQLDVTPTDTMLRVAVRGAVEAAKSYDDARGIAFARWSFIHATFRLLEHMRVERGHDKDTLARIRTAVLRFLAHDFRPYDPFVDSRERCSASLRSFSDALLVTAVTQIGPVDLSRGEEGLVEAEGASRAGDALRQVVSELSPEQRRLLERCFAYGETVKEAGKEMGKSYRSVIRDYHDLLGLLGTRLAGLGIKDMPPWRSDLSGSVFEEPGDGT